MTEAPTPESIAALIDALTILYADDAMVIEAAAALTHQSTTLATAEARVGELEGEVARIWRMTPEQMDAERIAEYKAWLEKRATLEDGLEVGAGHEVLSLAGKE